MRIWVRFYEGDKAVYELAEYTPKYHLLQTLVSEIEGRVVQSLMYVVK